MPKHRTIFDQYEHERKMLLQRIRRAKAKGWQIPDGLVPPTLPHTSSEKQLKYKIGEMLQLTPSRLRGISEATYNPDTYGEVKDLPATARPSIPYPEPDEYPESENIIDTSDYTGHNPVEVLNYTDVARERLNEIITHFPNGEGAKLIEKFFNRLYSENSETVANRMVGDFVRKHPKAQSKIGYSDDLARNFISSLLFYQSEITYTPILNTEERHRLEAILSEMEDDTII